MNSFMGQERLLQDATIALLFGVVAISAITDWRTGYVFDGVTIPAFGLVLVFKALAHALPEAVAGSLVVAGVPVLLYAVTRGRGIGLGDAKLALSLGAALGVRSGLLSLAVAFVLGGAIASLLLLLGKARLGAEIRFAPFMAAGTFFVALSGL